MLQLRLTLITVIVFISIQSFSQESSFIPEYVIKGWEEMTRSGGDWRTIEILEADGKPVVNEKYGLRWQWGLGKKSVIGDLYVIREGKKIGSLYQFRLFYHPVQKSIVSYQFGSDGTLGVGETLPGEGTKTENIAAFYSPEGTFKVRHVQEIVGDISHQNSYRLSENGEWELTRKYKWQLIPSE